MQCGWNGTGQQRHKTSTAIVPWGRETNACTGQQRHKTSTAIVPWGRETNACTGQQRHKTSTVIVLRDRVDFAAATYQRRVASADAVQPEAPTKRASQGGRDLCFPLSLAK